MFRDNGWRGESRCQFFTRFALLTISKRLPTKVSWKNYFIDTSPLIDLVSEVH